MAPAATPMKRLRELTYEFAFWAMTASVFAVVASARSAARWLSVMASCSLRERRGLGTRVSRTSASMISRITIESRALVARIWRRTRASSAGGTKPRPSATVLGPIRASASTTALSTIGGGLSGWRRPVEWVGPVEGGIDVLREEHDER